MSTFLRFWPVKEIRRFASTGDPRANHEPSTRPQNFYTTPRLRTAEVDTSALQQRLSTAADGDGRLGDAENQLFSNFKPKIS